MKDIVKPDVTKNMPSIDDQVNKEGRTFVGWEVLFNDDGTISEGSFSIFDTDAVDVTRPDMPFYVPL